MTAHLRPDLAALPAYVPGRAVPGSIKLASNEVPGGPLPSVRAAIADMAAVANRYPDMASVALIERVAQHVGTPADHVAVGCGSVSLCQQLMQATCADADDEVLFGWRSFEAYPILTHVVGARSVKVAVTAGQALDLDAMAAAVTDHTRLVFVCNPNNPTGTAIRRAELERFLDAVPPTVVVVLDEAYREFITDPDVPDGVALRDGRDNVVVLRTFSKAYGLAGLRVGYAVAHPDVAGALRKVQIPFSVNALAQAAAVASLDAKDELLARCGEIAAERDRVRDELLAAGYEVPESQANFVWLPLGDRATAFDAHCLERKVVGRAFAGDGVRVTIGTPEENDVFLTAARAFDQAAAPTG